MDCCLFSDSKSKRRLHIFHLKKNWIKIQILPWEHTLKNVVWIMSVIFSDHNKLGHSVLNSAAPGMGQGSGKESGMISVAWSKSRETQSDSNKQYHYLPLLKIPACLPWRLPHMPVPCWAVMGGFDLNTPRTYTKLSYLPRNIRKKENIYMYHLEYYIDLCHIIICAEPLVLNMLIPSCRHTCMSKIWLHKYLALSYSCHQDEF